MLHFTPLYKPSKGYMRLEKWEGDIGVRCLFALFADVAVKWITHMFLADYNELRAVGTFCSH
jgi:hypothetical protein